MDMWMDVDTALAEVPVNMMPLVDDTDFKTIEDAVAYDASGMDLRWNFVTTGGAYTSTAVTPTTGGNYDWAHQGDGMYSIEIPASGGASINNDTEGFGWFTGRITGVLPFRGPIIGFRAAGLNDLLIDSSYSATRGLAGTALPAAAADAAGGLPISDAGGLDLDAKIGALTFTTANKVDATVPDSQKVDVNTIKTQTVTLSGGVTIPAATLASTTNITGGTITTVTNLTNAPTAGDLTATMKTSVNTEVASALGTYDPPTRAELTSDINSVLARLRWVVIVDGTIGATGNDTTHVHLPGLTYGNDEINGYMLVLYDVSEDEYHWRKITDWVLATELATVDTLPFTPQNSTDTYAILATLAAADVTGGDATAANQATIISLLGTPAADVSADIAAVKTVVDAVLVDTAEIGTAGAGLTNINLPNQTMDIVGNITGNLSGSVGSVTGAVGSVTGNVGGNVAGSVASVTGAVGSVTGNVGGNVAGSVGSVTGAINTAAGTITTLDALDTAQDTQHSTTQSAIATVDTEVGVIDGIVDSILVDTTQIKADLPSRITKNTALSNFEFLMVDETDGYTAETGLTITATRSIDGGAFGACTNSATEVGTGVYKIDLSADDLNGNVITLRFVATGARTRIITIVTQP